MRKLSVPQDSTAAPCLLRARWVLPLTRPSIENGAVLIEGGRVRDVGRWSDLRSSRRACVEDLGEVILLPGLINAHCHLDYTGMAGQIAPPKSFSDWIKALLALKAHWTYSDYASSWLTGAKMLLRNGVTTVADIEAVPELLPEVRSATPLRVCSLLEMTGVRSRRAAMDIVREAAERIDALPALANWAGLSPHATYSTTPELLRVSVAFARTRHWLVATHLSESWEEFRMFSEAAGPMFDWLQPQRDMSDCGRGSPVEAADRVGLLNDHLLAIHVNYLAEGDASLLARRGASVVHCPRSHAYFKHAPFPLDSLRGAGVNVCVGTDSLVSTRATRREPLELSLLPELRSLQKAHPGLSAETLLRTVTVDAARALKRAGELGEIRPGACADLIVIAGEPSPRAVYETVVAHAAAVTAVMINGRWVHRA